MTETRTVAIPIPADLGPAMSALEPRQRAFVVAMYHNGGQREAAYLAAGYSGGTPGTSTCRAGAFQLYHRPNVQAAMVEYARARASALLPMASQAIEEMLGDVGHKDRAKLAMHIQALAGIQAVHEQRVMVHHSDDRTEKLERLVRLARAQGMDPRKLIGSLVDVTDADYEILGDEPKLEDIL